MHNLFKKYKKLKRILLGILGYLLLNFVLIVAFSTIVALEEGDPACPNSGFPLYLCVIWKAVVGNTLLYFSGFPITVLAVFMAFGFMVILLIEKFFGWSSANLDDEIYILSLIGLGCILLIYGIYIGVRMFFKRRKRLPKKSD